MGGKNQETNIGKFFEEQFYDTIYKKHSQSFDNSLTQDEFLSPFKKYFEIDKLSTFLCSSANEYENIPHNPYSKTEQDTLVKNDVIPELIDIIYSLISSNIDASDKIIAADLVKAIQIVNDYLFHDEDSEFQYAQIFVDSAFEKSAYHDTMNAGVLNKLKMQMVYYEKLEIEYERVKQENFIIKGKGGIEWRDYVYYIAKKCMKRKGLTQTKSLEVAFEEMTEDFQKKYKDEFKGEYSNILRAYRRFIKDN